MNPRDILPTTDQFKLVRGIEAELLQRRRKGMIGGIVGISAAVLQVILAVSKGGYAAHLGKFLTNLGTGKFTELIGEKGLPINEAIGMGVIVFGFAIYFTYRWTSLLAKESKEPFQYTFWMDQFEEVPGTPCERFTLKSKDRLNLFHHDLMERLSLRIRRLSLLNANIDVPSEARRGLTSHIHVKGNFAVRQLKNGKWVLQIMPIIRIGPVGRPETLTDPVKIELAAHSGVDEQELEPSAYNQLVERVYSIVASAIYKQIRSDLKLKSTLFPTSYLRAVALYYEAVDFERSNTIDAYDDAINLYRESKQYFDVRWTGSLSRKFVSWPILWRFGKRSVIADAETRIGFSRSLIYRRIVSVMSGRTQNVLFEIPGELELVTKNLEHLQTRLSPARNTGKKSAISESVVVRESPSTSSSTIGDPAPHTTVNHDLTDLDSEQCISLKTFLEFPEDSLIRRIFGLSRHDFEVQRRTLSGAYAVTALTNYYLGAPKAATNALSKSKAIHPVFSQQNPIWFLAQAELEPQIDKKLLFLKQMTELDPDFEIGQYRYAKSKEMKLRLRGEIQKDRIEEIIKEYDRVLEINPANIGALLAEGYLLWLIAERSAAERKFNEGCEIRAIARQTFTGESLYGLARIAVEKGEINKAYSLFTEAVFADPEVAANVVESTQVIQGNYTFMSNAILDRYHRFRRRAKKNLRKASPATVNGRNPDRAVKKVSSFVLNDYGNACLNYFRRFGDPAILRKAIKAYEMAIMNNNENFIAYFNLANAYGWYDGGGPQKYKDPLQEAEKFAPPWPALLIASVRAQIEQKRKQIERCKKELESAGMRKLHLLSQLQTPSVLPAQAFQDFEEAKVEAEPAKLAESVTAQPLERSTGPSASSKVPISATEHQGQSMASVENLGAEVAK